MAAALVFQFQPSFRCISASLNCVFILIALHFISHGGVRSSCVNTVVSNSCSVLYLSSSLGQDSPHCGNISRPCKSFSVILRNALLQESPRVCLNISAGSYLENQTLPIDCSKNRLQSLVLLGERNGQQQVYVSASFDIMTCELILFQVNFRSPAPVIIKAFVSYLLLCNTSVRDTRFSIIAQESKLEMIGSEISNCSGWRSWAPMLSVTSFSSYSGMLQISSSNISHNNGTVVSTKDLLEMSVLQSTFKGNLPNADKTFMVAGAKKFILHDSVFENNYGSLLHILDGTFTNLSNCVFVSNVISTTCLLQVGGMLDIEIRSSSFNDNWGDASGCAVQVFGQGSSMTIKNCEFKCNSLDRKQFVPPIQANSQAHVVCHNCSMDPNCPVQCPPGMHLTSGLTCVPCAKGTFSTASMGNTTLFGCPRCPAGYFSSEKGSSVCHPCEEDTVSKAGSSKCVKCSNDFFTSAQGESSCSRMKSSVVALTVVVCLLISAPLVTIVVRHHIGLSRRRGPAPSPGHRKPLCGVANNENWDGSIQG